MQYGIRISRQCGRAVAEFTY